MSCGTNYRVVTQITSQTSITSDVGWGYLRVLSKGNTTFVIERRTTGGGTGNTAQNLVIDWIAICNNTS